MITHISVRFTIRTTRINKSYIAFRNFYCKTCSINMTVYIFFILITCSHKVKSSIGRVGIPRNDRILVKFLYLHFHIVNLFFYLKYKSYSTKPMTTKIRNKTKTSYKLILISFVSFSGVMFSGLSFLIDSIL